MFFRKKDMILDNNSTEWKQKILYILGKIYDYVLIGYPSIGIEPVEKFANHYLQKHQTVEESLNSLIKWQIAKSATSGFITNLGGLITLPAAIPANLASVIFIQLRMISAIAHMGRYDLKSNQVKSFVIMCLCGNAVKNIIQEAGVEIGIKIATNTVMKIPEKIIIRINEKIGFRLLAKLGEKGGINIMKLVPIVGGVIGGSLDAAATYAIGNVAKKIFISGDISNID